MQERDTRDLVGGLLLLAVGLTAALYAGSHYRMGSVSRMGPGMVPTWLGVLLALFGLWLAVTAWMRSAPEGQNAELRLLVPFVIAVSIVAFALMIKPFGLIPSVFVAAIIATLAEGEFRPKRALITALSLCGICWLIFIAGLRLSIETAAWPF